MNEISERAFAKVEVDFVVVVVTAEGVVSVDRHNEME